MQRTVKSTSDTTPILSSSETSKAAEAESENKQLIVSLQISLLQIAKVIDSDREKSEALDHLIEALNISSKLYRAS